MNSEPMDSRELLKSTSLHKLQTPTQSVLRRVFSGHPHQLLHHGRVLFKKSLELALILHEHLQLLL